MKHAAPAFIAAAGILLFPRPADACGIDPPFAIIHNALPIPLPEGVIIADVEFEPADRRALYGEGARVRVRRMIQGEAVPALILQWSLRNSCQAPFRNGASGLIVAIPISRRDGLIVASPLFVDRRKDYRLPDGFQLGGSTIVR